MKLADYSDQVTVDQLDAALRAGGFDGVFHYVHGTFARRLELPSVVAGIRAKGWPQLAIDVPHLTTVDGGAAARAAIAYGFGAGALLALDIEPAQFDQDPGGWAAAADRWCPAVRAAGLSPGVYGVDRTVAACANGADWIWRAVPDECDPAGPGLPPAFFAGRRAIQCGAGLIGGVEVDVSYSQFTVEADDMFTDDDRKMLKGLFEGWFTDNQKLDDLIRGWQIDDGKLNATSQQMQAMAAAVGALKPLDVDQLAADLVAHLPAGADAEAVAEAVVDHLARRLEPPAQAQPPPST